MSDLDDFFAKKDRKKSKGKKYATSEEVAKKLEDKDTAKKVDKPVKKDRAAEGEEGGAPTHEQDEWREFEEEKKDYTGLKIGNLTINSQEGNVGGTETTLEQQQGEDSGSEMVKKAGPWKRLDSEAGDVEVEKPEPEAVPAAAPAPTSNVYVPPILRNSQQQQQAPSSRLRSKVAPDIHSQEYFPTLSSTKAEIRRNRNEGTFEMVAPNKASSQRHAEQTKYSNQGPKLSLGNRYNTLSNDS